MYKSPFQILQGAVLIGVMLSTCLYGITIVQTLLYFGAFKKDPMWRKCLVAFLFTLDTTNSALDIAFVYQSFILYIDAKWLFVCELILTIIITTTVQLFFAWRIKVLTSNKWVSSATALCTLAGTSAGFVTAASIARIYGLLQFQSEGDFQEFKASVLPSLALVIVADIIIAVTLVWHLKRNKTGFRATDDVIDRIIKITVPTGMITTVFAGAYIIAFVITTNGLSLAFYFPLSKLYTNSMMSSLNFRGRWSHATNKNNQQGSSQSLASSTQQMVERQQVHAGSNCQHPVSPPRNMRTEVFVQVKSGEVLDISGENLPENDSFPYASGWEDDL